MMDFRMELKVCEGCGALWLRAVGSGVYCRGCALWLSEFPAPRARSRRARTSKSAAGARRRGLHVCEPQTAGTTGGGR